MFPCAVTYHNVVIIAHVIVLHVCCIHNLREFCFVRSFYNNFLGASGREALKAAAKLTDVQIGYVTK